MGYAFISYSTKKQSSADAMKKLLNDNQIETWMAPDSIQPGSAYPGQIKLAVENCSCLVLLLSDMAQNSVWVSKEVERAINYHKTIIPIQIEDVNLNDDFEMYLNTCQIRTIPIIEASAKGMDEIVATVKALTGTTYKKPPSREKTEPEPVPKPKPPVPKKEDYGQRNVPSRKEPPIRVDNIFSSPKRKRKVSGKLIGGLIAAIVVLAVLLAIVLGGKHKPDDPQKVPQDSEVYVQHKTGDSVFIGRYEQNNNLTDGNESIEWIILDVKEDKALLISKYALDCQKYHSKKDNVTWETCDLRQWLNGTFLSSAFSADEQNRIVTANVSADRNPEYSTDPGSATEDKVFLLSIEEAKKYYSSDKARKCSPTAYAIAQGAYNGVFTKTTVWLLRSPGEDRSRVVGVGEGGTIVCGGSYVDVNIFAVRPALWITLDS